MGVVHKTKKIVIEKLSKHFGIKKRYAPIIYDILIESFTDVLKENKNIYVENLGRFSYYVNSHGKLITKFKPGDLLTCKLKNSNIKEFSNRKHRHMKDKEIK